MAREVKVHCVASVGKTAQLDTGPVALSVIGTTTPLRGPSVVVVVPLVLASLCSELSRLNPLSQ